MDSMMRAMIMNHIMEDGCRVVMNGEIVRLNQDWRRVEEKESPESRQRRVGKSMNPVPRRLEYMSAPVHYEVSKLERARGEHVRYYYGEPRQYCHFIPDPALPEQSEGQMMDRFVLALARQEVARQAKLVGGGSESDDNWLPPRLSVAPYFPGDKNCH
jgi:hypothetical protein